MFVTAPDAQVHMPVSLFGTGHLYWRSAELSIVAGWFLAVVLLPTTEDDHGASHTLLLADQADVLGLLQTEGVAEVQELHFFEPPWSSANRAWRMHRVVRIESCLDDERRGDICYVFTTAEGLEFDGFPGDLAPEALHSRREIVRFKTDHGDVGEEGAPR